MRFLSFYTIVAAVALSATFAHAAGPTGLLNDTGQTLCADAADAMVACDAATAGDAGTRPRQDGRFGRDVPSTAKIGGGAAGFDFTKVCMDGTLNCTGPANTSRYPAATDWACNKDNVTNLIWSLQKNPFISWNGVTAWNYTETYYSNAGNRCGYSTGWRLPTRRELLSIVDYGAGPPTIDLAYFPDTYTANYWTSEEYKPSAAGGTDAAWVVDFGHGRSLGNTFKVSEYFVRLVRDGQ